MKSRRKNTRGAAPNIFVARANDALARKVRLLFVPPPAAWRLGSSAAAWTNPLDYCSYSLASIPVGGCTSVFFAPISPQLVLSTVPPDSWKLLFIARLVSSSAFP